MDFDPTLLRAFVAVTEAGGFTRAAQRLHLTQSAVSHQIRRLEEQVGRPLLHRTTRSLRLTGDGDDFLRYARDALRSLDALSLRFQPSPVAGVVRFGAPENFMGRALPPLLCRFARDFPRVRLEVSVGLHIDLASMIQSGELDLAVVIAEPSDDEVPLRRVQLVWAAAESFAPVAGASLPLLFSPMPCVSRQVGFAALKNVPIDWHVAFTSPSQQDLCAAVAAGLGIAVLTRPDVAPGMRIVDGEHGLPPLPQVDFRLIWSEEGHTPAAHAFGELIRGLMGPPGGAFAQGHAAAAA